MCVRERERERERERVNAYVISIAFMIHLMLHMHIICNNNDRFWTSRIEIKCVNNENVILGC